MIVILSNISVMFLQTYDQLEPYYGILSVIEWVTTGIFCVEYILRIWTADFLYPTCTRGKAIGKFLISYDGVVDLLTIIPVFFLSGLWHSECSGSSGYFICSGSTRGMIVSMSSRLYW